MVEDFIFYKDNELYIEDLKVRDILAGIHATPAYLYSANLFRRKLRLLTSAFAGVPHLVCFSVKSCHNLSVLKLFGAEGCGMDIVSGGELYRARRADVSPQKIVYSGVGKTEEEIAEALTADILMFNVESFMELERIDAVARRLHKKARISFRVNPNVDAKTHPYITTGLNNNKFGIDHSQIIEAYETAAKMANIAIVGIDFHIGSQILDVQPFADAAKIVAEYVKELAARGIKIRYVDVGGGLGVPYQPEDPAPSADAYARAITSAFAGIEGITYILEPGRYLSAEAGILVTEVQYTKENSAGKKFVIVDTGMHHLIRPPLYGAYHEIVPVTKRGGREEMVSVVGPICESADFLAKDRTMEAATQGDLLAVMNAGAFGMVLSSNYNSHIRPAEVLADGDTYKIIRRPETYAEMVENEKI